MALIPGFGGKKPASSGAQDWRLHPTLTAHLARIAELEGSIDGLAAQKHHTETGLRAAEDALGREEYLRDAGKPAQVGQAQVRLDDARKAAAAAKFTHDTAAEELATLTASRQSVVDAARSEVAAVHDEQMRALIADLATTLQATIEKAEAARAYYWANCDPQYPPVQSFLATIADGSTFFDSGLAFGSLLAHEMVVALAGASQPGAVTHGFPLSRQWLAAYERWQTHEGAEGANIRVLTK